MGEIYLLTLSWSCGQLFIILFTSDSSAVILRGNMTKLTNVKSKSVDEVDEELIGTAPSCGVQNVSTPGCGVR